MTAKRNRRSKQKPSQESDLDKLILNSPPAFESFFIEEPKLIFARSFASVDPKTGIEQFGPFSSVRSRIRIGVIGTGSGIDAFRAYLERARNSIQPGLNARGKYYDPVCFPDFPGVNESSSFRCNFVTDAAIQRAIPEPLFENALKTPKVSVKLQQVITLIIKEMEALADTEPAPDVVIVVLPPIVEKECATVGAAFRGVKLLLTPAQKLERRLERVRQKTGQDFLSFDFGDSPVEGQKGYWNIHHALKAHAMKFGLPTQLVWEGRLRGQGLTQDPASMAWNFFTALYYKAGNVPWQLQYIPPNTCFVGVSFYKEGPLDGANIQTSLAQVFSGSGEGLCAKGTESCHR